MTAESFTDCVAIVTGGGSGIGRSAAHAFVDRGAAVIVADVDAEGGSAVVDEIEDNGGNATFVETDVSDADQVAEMVDTAVETYGRLDFALNNAGIRGERHPLTEYPNDAWQAVIDTNLTGVWNCVKHELGQIRAQGDGGAIVNTASVVGKSGLPNGSSYAAAKHGVIGVTKTAAMEVGNEDIRINAVCPGYIDTPMIRSHGDRVSTDEEALAEIKALHPQERLGRPDEVADAAVWLCSDEASYITGDTINVDGGFLAGK
jgi:NAD(P)-dependent dehydrogenase (short-subunit alcohol dehydrogenase family)